VAAVREDRRTRHLVGRTEDFPLGELRVHQLGRRDVCVLRTDDGFRAFQDRCPHQGAALSRGELTGTMVPSAPGEYCYGLEGRVVRCPWHRWEFSVDDGRSVGEVTRKRVVTYEVEVEGDDVFVLAR
jgi:nitrite reductase (NADH) small subunit